MERAKINKIIKYFIRYYPNPKCALLHDSPFELLIATILSAQCTDERVNQVTQTLFKKYPNVKSFAEADLKLLEQDIRPTGFYKNKAKNIKLCAQKLLELHDGEVPQTLEELTALAGVGRKTAHVVLGNAFQIPSGVVVDTHVTRLSQRIGFTRAKTAEKIELELNELVPQKHWIEFSHWLITHGRLVCKARKPQCDRCFLDEHCSKRI